jgi:multicomponent Na+:H+ antiporter subunit E
MYRGRELETMTREKIQHTAHFTAALLLCAFVWAVWNESYTTGTFIEGSILSFLALTITNRYLLKARYQNLFRLNPLTFLRYIGVLIVEIFRSGVHAMYVTITGRIDVGVVDLPTDITNPFHGVLVANAITLTPGTVTIDHSHGNFKVIWIECLTSDPNEAAEMIKGKFERVFKASRSVMDGTSTSPEATDL